MRRIVQVMGRDWDRHQKKFLEDLKKKMGGIDFKKHPPTEREKYECVKKWGYIRLEEIAFNRRRIKIRSK
jgi:hypothetical protein